MLDYFCDIYWDTFDCGLYPMAEEPMYALEDPWF